MAKIPSALGVDAGGTLTKIAAVSRAARVLRAAHVPTSPQEGPSAFVERLAALLEEWRDQGFGELGMGLGLAGDIDSERGRLRLAPNLVGWDGFEFRKAFAKKLKCPVVVDNDANVAVWGGYVGELRRRPANVVGITLGTGVGGGLVLERQLYRGSTGSAGEIGHMVVEPGGEPCHCGARGCLEAYAGGYGIERAARKVLAEDPSKGPHLARILRETGRLDPARITEAARQGDRAAAEVWRRTGRYLAAGIANLVLVLNPDVVLILGGVSRAGHWIMDPVRDSLKNQPFKTPFGRVKVVLAANHNGGCVGAALLAAETTSSFRGASRR